VIAAPARIDVDRAPAALAELSRALEAAAGDGQGGKETVLDLSGLAQFDSSALAVLLQLARERAGRVVLAGSADGAGTLAPAPGRLLITGAPAKLRELAELYGVDELLFGARAVG
jgi:phospholipid transport system transporter-binding protein